MLKYNPYKPENWEIIKIIDETPDVKTFHVIPRSKKAFIYQPGQFVEISIPGIGEAPISITSTPTKPGCLELSIKNMGRVTDSLHRMAAGDVVQLRGPYGNGFPMEELKGEDLLFIAGGIGLAPLRSVINYVIDKKDDYGEVIILYGARSFADLVFKEELKRWGEIVDLKILVTVDEGCEEWKGKVGVVTTLFNDCNLDPDKYVCLICGPHIMIHFAVMALLDIGFDPSRIITTLERMMKCGIGKCGHCNVGPKYVCQDGPVFNWEEIGQLYEKL